jgi:hypothetical protein
LICASLWRSDVASVAAPFVVFGAFPREVNARICLVISHDQELQTMDELPLMWSQYAVPQAGSLNVLSVQPKRQA